MPWLLSRPGGWGKENSALAQRLELSPAPQKSFPPLATQFLTWVENLTGRVEDKSLEFGRNKNRLCSKTCSVEKEVGKSRQNHHII